MKIKEIVELIGNKPKEGVPSHYHFGSQGYWAKKFSEVHLPKPYFCDVPQLGNNYADQAVAENRDVCPDCLAIYSQLTSEKKTEVKPKVKLTGQNGNVFNLMGICSQALKKAGQHENADKVINECMASHSYNEALNIMRKYCDVR